VVGRRRVRVLQRFPVFRRQYCGEREVFVGKKIKKNFEKSELKKKKIRTEKKYLNRRRSII